MADLIARTLVRLCSLLFPARGKHRATSTTALAPVPTPAPRPRRPLAGHKSPYARDAAEKRTFRDSISPVRPYILSAPRRHPDDPKRRAQAERRWAHDMALRGIDVGPATIHGVHVRPGSRTLRVAAA